MDLKYEKTAGNRVVDPGRAIYFRLTGIMNGNLNNSIGCVKINRNSLCNFTSHETLERLNRPHYPITLFSMRTGFFFPSAN